jgi:hypothetical protein
MNWRSQLRIDTIPVLLNSLNKALIYFTQRDLLEENPEPINLVWELPEALKIVRKQRPDGSWEKAGKDKDIFPPYHYSLIETFKRLRLLIDRYQFNKEHPTMAKAADFVFSCQTAEGDIRGFIGNQYATYYTGYVLSLFIKAGYGADPRVEKGMRWLISIRQDDGGWTVPFLTHEYDRKKWLRLTSRYAKPLLPDRTKPFSHMATDMVLRAFAAHTEYRKSKEARVAGVLLKSRFFKPDAYTSYQSPKYWTSFAFWWPNLLTSLETLASLGFTKDDPDIKKALNWFTENQQSDGLWKLESDKEIKRKDQEERLWVGLRVGRMLKKYYS